MDRDKKPSTNAYGQFFYKGRLYNFKYFEELAEREHIDMHRLGLCPNGFVEPGACRLMVLRRAWALIEEDFGE